MNVVAIVAHVAHVNVARNRTMKLTKESLKQIIKEELESVMDEAFMSLGPEDMGAGVDFNDEQNKAAAPFVKRLNAMPETGQASVMGRYLFHLKNKHPAFKGYKGDEMAIQNGLKKLGYDGYMHSSMPY